MMSRCDLACGIGKAREAVSGSLMFYFIYIINGLITECLVPQWVLESMVVSRGAEDIKVVPISDVFRHLNLGQL